MTKEQLERRCRTIEAELQALRTEIQSLQPGHTDRSPAGPLLRRNFLQGPAARRIPTVAGIALVSGLVFAQTGSALFIDERGNVGIGKSDKLDGFQVVLPGKQDAPGSGVTLSGGSEGNARMELRNNGSGTPYIDFALKGSGGDYDARIWLVGAGKLAVHGADLGLGTTEPKAKLDVQQGTRTGNHPAVNGLYVTGDFAPDSGVEFRHSNGTQGIGFGYNTIYATGSDGIQHLNLKPKGMGNVNVEGPLRARSLQIGNTMIGERELQILSKLAQGQLQVDIFNVKQGHHGTANRSGHGAALRQSAARVGDGSRHGERR